MSDALKANVVIDDYGAFCTEAGAIDGFLRFLTSQVGLDVSCLSDGKQMPPVIAPEIFADKTRVLFTKELLHVLSAARFQYLGECLKPRVRIVTDNVVGE